MPSESSRRVPVDLRLTEELRKELSRPIGPVLSSHAAREALKSAQVLATCGDVVTQNAMEWGLKPFISIVDGKTERKKEVSLPSFQPLRTRNVVKVKNDPGTISAAAQRAIRAMVEEGGGLMIVKGEEDLLVLPLMLEMPAGSIVIYGQPRRGLCMVTIDVKARSTALSILHRMEVA